MKKIKLFVAAAVMSLGLGVATLQPVGAINVFKNCNNSEAICKEAHNKNALGGYIKKIINILLQVLGIISVIVIIVGGIRYATSGGDSKQTAAAKDTILYAVVGLVVAILAYAIVNFVLSNLK